MRKIKFRAWNEKEKKMFAVGAIDFRYQNPLVLDNDDPDFRNKHTGQFPLMQFTGLKDKNGKEIYEGDIYTEGYERQDGSHKYGDRNIVEDIRTFHPQDEVEVIGNIYETPALVAPTK